MADQDWQNGQGPITEADLHAWLDGQLPPDRMALVEAYLADHPDDLDRFASYRTQADLIRRAYAPLTTPLPAKSPQSWRTPLRVLAALAAGVLVFVGGLGSGWWLHDRGQAPAPSASLASEALLAHRVFAVEIRHPVEVSQDQESHLVAWLSRRLDRPLTVPRLAGTGFTLMGGRLLPGIGGPAAQLMYQNSLGERITLYIEPNGDGQDTAFRFAQDGRAAAFYWQEGGLSWAIAGEADRVTLQDLARRIYGELNS